MRKWGRQIGRGAAVVVMMVVGAAVLSLALMAVPSNVEPGTTMLSDLGLIRFLFGFLALFLLPFYRRVPLLLIGVGVFCAVILGNDPFVLAVGLAVWVGRAQKRWEWWVAGIALAAIVANALRLTLVVLHGPDDDRALGVTTIVSLLLLCVSAVVGIGLWIRQRKKTDAVAATAYAAQRNTAQLADELTRQREREELAREVHDTLASRLSAIALQTGSLESAARGVDDPILNEAMSTVRENASNALGDLRTLLTSLRAGGAPVAAPHTPPGGLRDVQDLFDDAAAAGLSISPYVVVESFSEAPDSVRRAVVRITQEALTNALRHSSDRAVNVRIEGGPGRGLRLEFANRYGYGPEEFDGGSHSGLLGVEERAQLVGGVARHQRSDGRFVLSADLPWDRDVV